MPFPDRKVKGKVKETLSGFALGETGVELATLRSETSPIRLRMLIRIHE